MVNEFKMFALPLQTAETSVLVDVLHAPERLFISGSDLYQRCENGVVIGKLIQHCKSLLQHGQEALCVRVLQTLCQMASNTKYNFINQAREVRINLLKQYFGNDAQCSTNGQTRKLESNGYEFGNELKPVKELSLYDVQCKLNSAGASVALPLQTAETSVLVDVLHAPERLFISGSDLYQRCENGVVIGK
ncbi:hypothetical protein WUBG_11178 [Wuchereria bancrofti]|uniref:Uncharacterized protein n=1 Tax=Wuchereria bancrofti TaxID=6293 RepID=J9ELI9_WUCBA|nr:hypothetical protein WUBG_11178 [Wuchereria bancrofti]